MDSGNTVSTYPCDVVTTQTSVEMEMEEGISVLHLLGAWDPQSTVKCGGTTVKRTVACRTYVQCWCGLKFGSCEYLLAGARLGCK